MSDGDASWSKQLTKRFGGKVGQPFTDAKQKLSDKFQQSDKRGMTPEEIQRHQALTSLADTMDNVPAGAQNDASRRAEKDALKAMDAYNQKPDAESLANAQESLQHYRDQLAKNGASPATLAKVDEAIKALDGNPDDIDFERQRQGKATDKVLLDTDVEGVPNGQQLKDNARDAVASFTADPTDANLARSISSVKALRDQMEANGASAEQLKPLDDQLNKLQGLQGHKVDVVG